MVNLYSEETYLKENTRRIKYLYLYIAALILVVICETALMIYYATRPFGTPLEIPLLIIILSIGALFTVFSVVFLTIPYGRLKKYCEILGDFLDNEKVVSEVTVLGIDKTVTVKYGVDFYRLNVLEWSTIENDYVERSILVDNEIKTLDFKVNDIVKIVTTSNMLIGYEV